jgi:hypothetical protein
VAEVVALAVLDHTVPVGPTKSEFKIQSRNPGVTEYLEMPDRGHSLTIDHVWQEVAQAMLDFVVPTTAPAIAG